MTHCLFLTCEGPTAHSADFCEWIRHRTLQWLNGRTAQIDVDLFKPAPGEVALFEDGLAPAAMLELSASKGVLLDLIAGDCFNETFHQGVLEISPDVELSIGLFRALATAVAGAPAAVPRTAALSFVVRYYGPSPDDKAFQDFYTSNHPPILAKFPAIRNVFCYLPEPMPVATLPRSEVMLGNEVVFDDLTALNAALKSDVLVDLKADSARFPPFGHSTHHAMLREKLF